MGFAARPNVGDTFLGTQSHWHLGICVDFKAKLEELKSRLENSFGEAERLDLTIALPVAKSQKAFDNLLNSSLTEGRYT